MKNIKSNQRGKMKVAKIFALLMLSLLFGGNSFAAGYVSLDVFPKQTGVFTSVGKQQFIVFGVRADGIRENITRKVDWHSSNESLVNISESGMATVVASVTSGRVQVSCTYPKKGMMTGPNSLLL